MLLHLSSLTHILFLSLTLTPSVKHSESSGVSTVNSSLQDIDGDGLPDIVYSDSEDHLIVRRNLTGRTNMLNTQNITSATNHVHCRAAK